MASLRNNPPLAVLPARSDNRPNPSPVLELPTYRSCGLIRYDTVPGQISACNQPDPVEIRRYLTDRGGGGCDDRAGLRGLAFGSQQIYYLADFTELGLLGLGINRKNGW